MILDAHPQFTEAVGHFAADADHHVVVLSGNHDGQLAWDGRSVGQLSERLGVEVFALQLRSGGGHRARAPAGAGGAREPVGPLQRLRGSVVPGGHPVRPPRGPRPPARARVAAVARVAPRGGPVAGRGRGRLHRLPPLLPQGRRATVAGGRPLRGHPAPPPALLPPRHAAASSTTTPNAGCSDSGSWWPSWSSWPRWRQWRPCSGSTVPSARRRSAPGPIRPATTPPQGRGGPPGDPGVCGHDLGPYARARALGGGKRVLRQHRERHRFGGGPQVAVPAPPSLRHRAPLLLCRGRSPARYSSSSSGLREIPVKSPVLLERLALARGKVATSTTTAWWGHSPTVRPGPSTTPGSSCGSSGVGSGRWPPGSCWLAGVAQRHLRPAVAHPLHPGRSTTGSPSASIR